MNERDVFIAALQLDARAERQAYLDAACGDDQALRQRVEALLETHARVGDFLEEPASAPVAAVVLDHFTEAQTAKEYSPQTQSGATEPAPPSLTFLSPPQQPDELGRLGHYRVLRLLGEGGMGLVLLADDPQLQRPVALKVMRPELAANPEGRQRFRREALSAARIRSDHIVTIYHVDQEGDLPYIVMEVLRGQSLAETLEQMNQLPLGQCLKIARQTAEGLAAAHASGVIHRDVKPGNIWLEEPGGRVKLLDFGLARTCTGPLITQYRVLLGTPAYMSPEQAASRPLDARCDLFSLGAVLYHMLTGQRPFAGEDVLTVLSNLANVTPSPATELVPGLPVGVADLLDRLLAKDPALRPSSAVEVARTLLVLEKEAAEVTPSTSKLLGPKDDETNGNLQLRVVLLAHIRRWLALAGGLAIVVLLIGLLIAMHTSTPRGLFEGPAAPGVSPTVPADPAEGLIAPAKPIQPFTLTGHGSQIQTLAFTADGNTLVSAEYWGMVKFWDLDHHETTFEMPGVPARRPLQCIALDPQQRWLAVALQSVPGQVPPPIRLFPFRQSVVAVFLEGGHTDRVSQLVFLRDGQKLLSAGFDGSIRRWNVTTRQQDRPLRDNGPRIDCLDVWEDGQGGLRLALGGFHFAGIDDIELEHLPYGNGMAALSPDGTRLACSKQERMSRAKDSFVALWKLPDKTSLGELPDAPKPLGLAFTSDSKHVVVTGAEFTGIYETESGWLVARVDHPDRGTALAVSPDGRWLAVGTLKGLIRVWHLPSLLAAPA